VQPFTFQAFVRRFSRVLVKVDPFNAVLLFQTILLYLTVSYPRYQGSVLAGNDFVNLSN
jgi:hypothetical protein